MKVCMEPLILIKKIKEKNEKGENYEKENFTRLNNVGRIYAIRR